jgi:hypothetical protein
MNWLDKLPDWLVVSVLVVLAEYSIYVVITNIGVNHG